MQPGPEGPRCGNPSIGIVVDKGGNFEALNGGPDRATYPIRSRGLEGCEWDAQHPMETDELNKDPRASDRGFFLAGHAW
jgi:hypothetical protein